MYLKIHSELYTIDLLDIITDDYIFPNITNKIVV